MRWQLVASSLFLASHAIAAQAEDWRQIAPGANSGAITTLYVEAASVRREGGLRYAWVFASFDTTRNPYRYKKELMAIDCLRNQFEGMKWLWVDTAGRMSESDDADVRWTRTLEGSPADAISKFVCAA